MLANINLLWCRNVADSLVNNAFNTILEDKLGTKGVLNRKWKDKNGIKGVLGLPFCLQ